MTARERHIDAMIEAGDVAGLLALAEWAPCACTGPQDDDPLCPCSMNEKIVRAKVAVSGLKRGQIIELSIDPKTTPERE